MDKFQVIASVLSSMAVITASILAIIGIKQWKREFQGKKKYDFVEELMALIYEARDKIKTLRAPFSYVGEGRTRKQEEGETEDEKRNRDYYYIVFERYQQYQDFFNRLFSKKYRFLALFINEYKKCPVEVIEKILNDIMTAAYTRTLHYDPVRGAEPNREKGGYYAELQAKITFGGTGDEINKQLDNAVKDMEKICKEVMKNI